MEAGDHRLAPGRRPLLNDSIAIEIGVTADGAGVVAENEERGVCVLTLNDLFGYFLDFV